MKQRNITFLFFLALALFFSSCNKGYEIRFTNYYIEPMDSVIVGNNTVIFKNVDLQTNSDYTNIKKGKYTITCISKNKKRFYSNITIPKDGGGKRSIQIDAITNFSILEDD